MKFRRCFVNLFYTVVAPLAGAWVEILVKSDIQKLIDVAPLAGAWVEIALNSNLYYTFQSLPSRGRGLKYQRWVAV